VDFEDAIARAKREREKLLNSVMWTRIIPIARCVTCTLVRFFSYTERERERDIANNKIIGDHSDTPRGLKLETPTDIRPSNLGSRAQREKRKGKREKEREGEKRERTRRSRRYPRFASFEPIFTRYLNP